MIEVKNTVESDFRDLYHQNCEDAAFVQKFWPNIIALLMDDQRQRSPVALNGD